MSCPADYDHHPSSYAEPAFHLGYQPALDGIRAFAVLIVLAGHFKLPLFEYGALGVDIFFALSGFLITTLLCEEWLRNGSIRLGQFYLRRVLRLYPALLLMLLAVGFITPAREYILSSLTYTTNWVIALKIRPLSLELGHTWTLAIEEQYYLLWPPLLIYLLKRFPPRRVILVPLAIAALSWVLRIVSWNTLHEFWRYNAGTDTHADGLLLGSALGLATVFGLLPKGEKAKIVLRAATALLLAVMLWATVAIPQPEEFFVYFGVTGVAVTTLLVVSQLVIFPSRAWRRLLEFPLLVKIGTISYGLYLWQVPVIVLLKLERIGIDPAAVPWIQTVVIFLIVILSYRYVEKPIQRLKNRFSAPQSAAPILRINDSPL